jgi:hypothetical protein
MMKIQAGNYYRWNRSGQEMMATNGHAGWGRTYVLIDGSIASFHEGVVFDNCVQITGFGGEEVKPEPSRVLKLDIDWDYRQIPVVGQERDPASIGREIIHDGVEYRLFCYEYANNSRSKDLVRCCLPQALGDLDLESHGIEKARYAILVREDDKQ